MHKHLSKSERCKIEVYFQEGFTISAIASKIGRQRSTIRDEITRNSANGLSLSKTLQFQWQPNIDAGYDFVG